MTTDHREALRAAKVDDLDLYLFRCDFLDRLAATVDALLVRFGGAS